jgi:hypothetical protein
VTQILNLIHILPVRVGLSYSVRMITSQKQAATLRREIGAFSASRPTLYFEISLRA